MIADPEAGAPPAEGMRVEERAKLLMEAWKKTVDVQQHFNDTEMRIRNLALTIIGAVVAFARVLDVGGDHSGHLVNPGLLFLALTILVGAFWFMDRHWYHRLLLGAVLEGAELERRLTELGIQVGLGTQISAMSPIMLFGRRLRSNHKLDAFYLVLGTMSFLAMAGSFGLLWFWLSLLMAIAIWWWRWLTVPLAT